MKQFTFIDLFAGAGGFSEGFLQAEDGGKSFEFLLASDINENCELTHVARYNEQLGLPAAFLRMDIQDPGFIGALQEHLKGRPVDVVCGGPPCQSFSLAGRRRRFDKKDDLFARYIEVIRVLRPKYFVMENVLGILTKHNGEVRQRILEDIKSIVDTQKLKALLPSISQAISKLKSLDRNSWMMAKHLGTRLEAEAASTDNVSDPREQFVAALDQEFRTILPQLFGYDQSKTDARIGTIRHGIRLLTRASSLDALRINVLHEKTRADVDNDKFVSSFDSFLSDISEQGIVNRILEAIDELGGAGLAPIKHALMVYTEPLSNCLGMLLELMPSGEGSKDLEEALLAIHLYKIDSETVVNAANYGVPQSRERVLFVGSRVDQRPITCIRPTVTPDQQVTVFEALHDLDIVGINEAATSYSEGNKTVRAESKIFCRKHKDMIRKRDVNGGVNGSGLTYAGWSAKGRIRKGLSVKNGKYYRSLADYEDGRPTGAQTLYNHETSNHNDEVQARLQEILNAGDYNAASTALEKKGLASKKRNYNVLKADAQSPTVVTIPDDYIHYRMARAPSVRELARLQSFDDSFVFQGKRSTGGEKRKDEVPQYTLVGNAVPPLVARAIAMELLQHLK